MEYLQSIVLGVVQGITEFLPISSDGHLTLVPLLLGWDGFDITFDVALHLGTLAATVAYFRHDVVRILGALFSRDDTRASDRRLGWLMVVATLASVAVVLPLEAVIDEVDSADPRRQAFVVGIMLLVTTVLLLGSEYLSARRARTVAPSRDASKLTWGRAAFIGFAQGFAPFQGLSRSGTTMAAGLAMGLDREESARFSFLLSIPIVFAAVMKKLVLDLMLEPGALDSLTATPQRLPAMLLGIVVTSVVGYGAITFLLPFVRKHSLGWFAAYTAVVGIGMLVWSLT